MNTKYSITQTLRAISCASAVSLLTAGVLAQENTSPRLGHSESTRDRLQKAGPSDRLNSAVKASDLIGMTVNNYQNEKLAKVEDLAIDVESGRIVQVILSAGGFLGIGEALTAVPPGALHHDTANKVLHLDSNKEKLKNAPRFDMAKWSEYSTTNRLSEVYRYHGDESGLHFLEGRESTLAGQSNIERSPRAEANKTPAGNWEKNRQAMKRHTTIPASRLGQLQQVSKLMGSPVQNLQNEKIGEVENVLVDIQSGRLIAVIVSSGGFLGMGDELSAVPPTALRRGSNPETFQLDSSKEMLSKAPHFKANEWPDFSQPSYADSVYRAYQVEPYFTTNTVTEPDNTERNIRDRNDSTLNPLDQGNGASDINITAQIRRGIMDGEDFSVNAQNVKIITNKGQVTLRGPVNTAEEKRRIGVIANDIARVDNVSNQLDVK